MSAFSARDRCRALCRTPPGVRLMSSPGKSAQASPGPPKDHKPDLLLCLLQGTMRLIPGLVTGQGG